MDDETRAAFARMDRYFELSQLQHLELRSDVAELKTDVAELRAEFRSFRDWATQQFAEIRAAIRDLTRRLERVEG